jgi:hypothetical protein
MPVILAGHPAAIRPWVAPWAPPEWLRLSKRLTVIQALLGDAVCGIPWVRCSTAQMGFRLKRERESAEQATVFLKSTWAVLQATPPWWNQIPDGRRSKGTHQVGNSKLIPACAHMYRRVAQNRVMKCLHGPVYSAVCIQLYTESGPARLLLYTLVYKAAQASRMAWA